MEYYQKNADPKVFNEKFDKVCQLPRYPETTWTMFYHLYKDNADEMDMARRMAESYNLKFVAIPCIFMVGEKVIEKNYSNQDLDIIEHLRESPEEAIKTMTWDDTYCGLWKQITIDANGNIYLCQLLYENRFRIGHFKGMRRGQVIRKMKSHPFCQKCLKVGMGAYQSCYSEVIKYDDPIGDAERKRRK